MANRQSWPQLLMLYLNERMSKATEDEIIRIIEEKMPKGFPTESEEQDIDQRRRLLDAILKPVMKLHRIGDQGSKTGRKSLDYCAPIDDDDEEKEEDDAKPRQRKACTCPLCKKRRGKKKLPLCGKTSPLRAHPCSRKRPFVCHVAYCGRAFARSGQLQRHISTHTGVKLYVCHKCPKRFMRRDHLSKHVKTHKEKKRQHMCHIPGCGVLCGKTSELRAHLCRHSGERPFVCDVASCGRAFARSDVLQRHARTHTGVKLYVCHKCPKSFMRSDHLSKHVKTHLEKKRRAPRRGYNWTFTK